MHDIFIQYGDLLGEQLSGEELVNFVPDFATLTGDFGLDYPSAFQVVRSRLQAQIEKEDNDKMALLKEKLLAQREAAKANGGPAPTTPPLSPVALTPPLSPAEGGFKELAPNGDHPNETSVPAPKPVSPRRQLFDRKELTCIV